MLSGTAVTPASLLVDEGLVDVHPASQLRILGQVFDTYDAGSSQVESIGGYPTLMGSALDGVKALPDGFVAAGFSNGGGLAE